jgi:hypothetical protein
MRLKFHSNICHVTIKYTSFVVKNTEMQLELNHNLEKNLARAHSKQSINCRQIIMNSLHLREPEADLCWSRDVDDCNVWGWQQWKHRALQVTCTTQHLLSNYSLDMRSYYLENLNQSSKISTSQKISHIKAKRYCHLFTMDLKYGLIVSLMQTIDYYLNTI